MLARDRVLLGIVATSTVLRLVFAWVFFGFVGGDDVEILQTAFRTAVGLSYSPWEIRNLLQPQLLVAPAIGLARALGVGTTAHLVFVGALPNLVLASVNVVLVYRLGSCWLGSPLAGRAAALLYAFHWLPLGYGSTVYPRTISATCVLLGALLLASRSADTVRGLAAGGLLSVAFAVRYSEALFGLPLLALAWANGADTASRVRRSVALIGGATFGALLTVGVCDVLAWGKPFASLIAFARFTLVERQSSSLTPVQPSWWYLKRLLFWIPPTLLPLLAASWMHARARIAWWFVVAPLVVLSLIHHKELRYLQASIPFLALLGAAGFVVMLERGRRRLAISLLALTLVVEVSGVRFLARKSMAAVEAARWMAKEPGLRTVAVSQKWAYGDGLYFGTGIRVVDLPTPPSAGDLAAARDADLVALYLKDIEERDELEQALMEQGFARERTFCWGRSKAVVVFGRSPS